MKKLNLLAVVLTGFVFTIVSCQKGTTGPKGDRGPAGPDSVIYSNWTPLAMSFQDTTSAGDSIFAQTITALKITSTVLEKDAILSYIGVPGSGTSGTDTAVFSVSEASTFFGPLTQNFLPGEIDLVSIGDYSGALYRYVIIPGTILTTNSILKGYTREQLKAIDYSTLSKALGVSSSKTTN